MLKSIILGTLLVASASVATAHERHGDPCTMLGHADKDGDGAITRDEFRNSRIEAFARFDSNSDGFLDAADRPARHQKSTDAKPAGEQDQADGTVRQGQWSRHGHHGWHHRGGKGLLERMDANADGKLSQDEFVEGAMSRFDKADTDGNGVLDAKELEAMKSAAKQRTREMRPREMHPQETQQEPATSADKTAS